jgi:hypothetical protein
LLVKTTKTRRIATGRRSGRYVFLYEVWAALLTLIDVIYRTAEIAIADVAATGAPGEATKEVIVTGVVRETVVAVVLTVASAMTVTVRKIVLEILRKTRRLQ